MSARMNMFASYLGRMSLAKRNAPGLVECQEMDSHLAAVASAKLQDIPGALFEEILLSTDFLKLLKMRRVSSTWKAVISRESAPFLRQVCIDLTVGRYAYCEEKKNSRNIWQYAKQVRTIFLFEDPTLRYGLYGWSGHSDTRATRLLDAYQSQVKRDKRTVLLNKLVYGHTAVGLAELEHAVTRRSGFSTVLHQSKIGLLVSRLFEPDAEEATSIQCAGIFGKSIAYVEIGKQDFFQVTENDLLVSQASDKVFTSSLVDLFIRNASPLPEVLIFNLCNGIKSCYGLSTLLAQLVKRFDPDNRRALQYAKSANIRRFMASTHPVVSVLLHQYDETVKDHKASMQRIIYAEDTAGYDSDGYYDYNHGYPEPWEEEYRSDYEGAFAHKN